MEKKVTAGCAVSIKIICFKIAFNESNSVEKPGAYITHNTTWPLSDITGGNLSDYKQPPLGPHIFLATFFTYVILLPKTCKDTMMFKIYGVALKLKNSLFSFVIYGSKWRVFGF